MLLSVLCWMIQSCVFYLVKLMNVFCSVMLLQVFCSMVPL